jgi:hypothetical protein
MKNKVEITLQGTKNELTNLFSYDSDQWSELASLPSYIAHLFNQTLVRDQIYGAWAQVLEDNGNYVLKMYAPHNDLSAYEDLIPTCIDAAKIGLDIYEQNKEELDKIDNSKVRFLLPFGLSMAKTKSIQLLHYPPLETFVFNDYLYSPTNRRWENLLNNNEIKITNFTELESIIDCVPLAAPGNDGDYLKPYNNIFTDYVKKMLEVKLDMSGPTTQPVVAYGGPVRDWLEQAYPEQITESLDVLTLLNLNFGEGDSKTPVLCANHPSKYLYQTDKPYSKYKEELMTQDLIAAGWQSEMIHNPKQSPQEVLDRLTNYWTDNSKVIDIMNQEDAAYGYNL